ncbi:phosphotransferase family protein [Nitrospirillum sp. BR 11752]|uniref:phosphotransferase family protein n=1 Tax=Nitrospirillum sp. BR 11752 TaxID=3104293 RepID=UPI002E9DED0F|nr:phosphotransferase family protein [Nitrospirillum sp. BR 11752]
MTVAQAETPPRPVTDRAGPVRAGEELDVATVDRWLKGQRPTLTGQPQVTQYSGGASNWTYRLAYGEDGAEGDFILRRPPAGTKAKSAHDMVREFRVQQALKPVFPWVPTMVGLCQDDRLIGADFYVMERIAGIIPRANLPRGLDMSPDAVRRLCLAMVDKLVALHRVDPEAAGLSGLGKGEGYCRRQVEGWSGRYLKARTWNVPSFARVRAWLAANTPADSAACVIHNDWRFDNLVLDAADPTRVIGVLDWEMATIGDPLMDLGGALAYWVQADDDFIMRSTRRQPTHLPGMLTRDAVVAHYLAAMGDRLDAQAVDWTFYEVFGLFRLAVIAQQIYYRYHHRQTRNPAFKRFWLLVTYLDWRCRRILRWAGR